MKVVTLFGIMATHPYNTKSKSKLIMARQELDASIIDPSREVEESEIGLKEELHKLKHQMAEMYQTQDNQYYPSEPTFKAPDHYSYTPRIDLPVETEKPPKIPEQEEMFRKVRILEQSLRNMQGLGGQVSVAYKDMCLFPNVHLPVGFKMPKFDLYDGHGDLVAHLRVLCSKMRGASGKDELLIAYFSQSLSGAALEWYTRQDHNIWYAWDDLAQVFTHHFQYNIEIVLDRLSLTKIEKKPSESLREYGFRWREQAVRVNLPMEEIEMVEYFLQALEPTYFGHLISAIGKSFNEVVKMGEMVEERLKSSKIMSYPAIKATTQAIQNGTGGVLGKKKIEDVAMSPEAPNINQNLLPAHAEMHMIETVHKDGKPKKPSQSVMMIRSSKTDRSADKLSMQNDNPPMVVEKRSPSVDVAKQEKPKVIVPGVASKPIIIVEGARTDPIIIKLVTQVLVANTKTVPWNYERVIVTYKGKEVKEEVNEAQGLTRSGRCFALEELRKAKTLRDNPVLVKKPVTEEEADEFLRKIKIQDYSIIEQLRKTPAQISLLSLLIHSDEHRRALMKILNKAHLPNKIIVNHLEKITNKIFESNEITLSDDDLPIEGTEHNRALYLTVKCEDSMVTRLLVGNGSSANICPLSTLNKLKVDDGRIHKNNICVRGFDGRGKDFVGDIMLELTIGPVEFTMEFQVLDVDISYNLLLGRPWIHVAKAVPSSLHQMVKFELDRKEIVVHGDVNLCAFNDTFVPFIEDEEDKGPWVYQMSETVSVEKDPEGEYIPCPKLAFAIVMVETEMLKNGFMPGKGLSAFLQGDNVKKARKLKKKAWSLPKAAPRLSRSFIKAGVVKRSVITVPKPVVDFDEELVKRFQQSRCAVYWAKSEA
ncbi:uncharacterized protein [Nicotiana sylvestris]|uniref:uncharacterized protein n=1 Tax=Nicotiana sylvestris TaxID=4096 RepID=UPI00388C43EB